MPSPPGPTPHVPATADEELLCCLGPGYPGFADDDPDRVARIRDEVTYGFAALADVEHAVSIFGSARTPADDRHYILARTVAARVGRWDSMSSPAADQESWRPPTGERGMRACVRST